MGTEGRKPAVMRTVSTGEQASGQQQVNPEGAAGLGGHAAGHWMERGKGCHAGQEAGPAEVGPLLPLFAARRGQEGSRGKENTSAPLLPFEERTSQDPTGERRCGDHGWCRLRGWVPWP